MFEQQSMDEQRSFLYLFLKKALSPFKWYLLGWLFTCVLLALDVSIRPYILSLIIDTIGSVSYPQMLVKLRFPVIFYLFVAVLSVFTNSLYNWITLNIVPGLKKYVTELMVGAVTGHSYEFLQDQMAGCVSNKINDVVCGVPALLCDVMDGVIYYVFALLAAIFTVLQVNYKFSIAISSWVVFVLTLVLLTLNKSKNLSDSTSEWWTLVAGRILDVISNIATIRFFARREYEMGYLNSILAKAVRVEQGKNAFFLKLYAIQASSFVALQCVCLWMLVFGIRTGSVTAGDFALVLTINGTVAEILYSLSRSLRIFAENLGKVAQGLRVIELPLGRPLEEVKELSVSSGEICFKNVYFSYKGCPPLFCNKTLTISAGQKIGLVGHSGSGKSTFVNLVLRMFKPQSGQILIDGQDISGVSFDSIGNSIAVIPQEPQLFHRTLMENIRYGKLDATDEEVIAAAKIVQAHDFIVNLADGYNSLVGDRGVKLSGGQKQRIVIARAILKHAPILILDEATSGLDLLVESEVQGSLWQLMKGKTVVVIAHRLTTLLQMDKIFVFKQGVVVEEGSHIELLAKDGVYKSLWKMQTGALF